MKKIILILILVAAIFSLTGCGGSGGGSKTTGTYYEYDKGGKKENSWFELKAKNKWADDDGLSGRYEITDNTIVFYSVVFGSEEEMFSGTFDNGVITITIKLLGTTIYAKDGALPSLDNSLDIISTGDLTKDESNLSINVDYELQTFNLENQVTISSGGVLKVYSDSSKKKLVENNQELMLTSNSNTFYIDIVDPNHNVAIKSYTLRIIKDVPYTVDFKNTDGSLISTIQVIMNQKIESVPIELVNTPQGFEVVGWYYKTYDPWGSSINNPVDDILNFPINKHYTFFPTFSEKTYKATLSDLKQEYEIKYNERFNLPIAYKEGYEFGGWEDSINNKVTDKNGSSLSKFTYSQDVTFKAIWIPNNYRLYIEGASGGKTNPTGDINVPFGSKQTLTATPNSGYEFDGWYNNNKLISSDTTFNYTMPNNAVILTPRFKIITYTITYHLDGGINSVYNNKTSRDINTDRIYLSDPTKEFYTFVGWSTNKDFMQSITNIPKGHIGNIDLYAMFKPTQYQINYFLDNGKNNTENKASYSILDEFTLKAPTRAGYTFEGWYSDSSCKVPAVTTIKKGSTGAISFYANWTMNTYNIIYNLNGGTNHQDNILTGDPTTSYILKAPTRKGYTFDGWFTQPDYRYMITSISNVTKDVNIYARWIANNYDGSLHLTEEGSLYRVRFYENGANEKIDDIIVTNKIRLVAPKAPTKSGFLFAGWCTDYELNNIYKFDSKTIINSDIELYAKWMPEPSGTRITSSLLSQNGSGIYYYSLGSGTVTLSVSGWSVPSGFLARLSFGPKTITSAATSISIDVEPYKTYSINAYYWNSTSGLVQTAKNMNFSVYGVGENIQGGLSEIATARFTYDKHYELVIPEMKYHQFEGWFTLPNGEGDQLTDELGKSISPWTIANNTKLYAKFTEKSYEITYEIDGKTTNHKDNLSEYGLNTKGPINDPEKPYYTFHGWYLNSEFKGRKVELYEKIMEDVTLYPKFIPIQYSIQYHLNGGKGNTSLKTGYNVESKFDLVDPTRTGYTFEGWYFDEAFTESFTGKFDGNTNGNLNLYAKWKAIDYKLTYELNLGTQDPEAFNTYTIEDDKEFKIPTRNGYTFMGWFKDPEFGEQLVRIDLGTYGDYTLYAKWIITEHKINYQLYGGINHVDNPVFTTILSRSYELFEPILAGYTFEGWFTDAEFTKPITTIPAYTNEVLDIYAKFTPLTFTLTFETNGGKTLNSLELNTDQEIEFKDTQKDNYSFVGWYLDKELTIKSDHKVMPAHDLVLYAKWVNYGVNINYNSSLKAVRAEGDILATDFDAVAVDTDGDQYPIKATIVLGSQEPTTRIVVRLSATGKYGYTKSITIENVIVYGTPTITYDDKINSIKVTDEITLALFNAVARDTENNILENTIIEIVEGEFVSGQTISLKISTVDIIGNKKEVMIEGIKVYGTPTITAEDTNLKSSKTTIVPKDFNAIAKDSFEKNLTINASVVKYNVKIDRKNGSNVQNITVIHNDYLHRPSNPSEYYQVFEGWYYKENGVEKRFDFYQPILKDYEIYAKYISSSQTNSYIYYNLLFNYNVRASGRHTSVKYKFYSELEGEHKFEIQNPYAATGVNARIRIYKNNLQVDVIFSYNYNQSFNVQLEKNTLYDIEVETNDSLHSTSTDRKIGILITHSNYSNQTTGIPVKLYQLKATDHLGNEVIVYKNVYLYSEPTINVSGKLEYIVDEEITLETLGVTAIDTFNEEITSEFFTLTLVEGELTAGSTVVYKITATDKVGNVATKEITVKIYGKPTIDYTPRDGIRANEEILATTLKAIGKDSHGKSLNVTAQLQTGSSQTGGSYVNIILTVTDHLDQTTEIIVKDIPVYDVEELYFTIKTQDITEVSLYNNAEEFQPLYTSSFGKDGVKVYIERADKSPLIHDEIADIVIVFEDPAGNKKYSEVIKNIKLFDHEVTFYNEGNEISKKKIKHNSSLLGIIPNITKSYSYLDGWYTEADGKGDKYLSTNNASFDKGYIELHANWIYRVEFVEANKYNVYFYPNGGNFNGSTYTRLVQVTDTSQVSLPDSPSRNLYRFDGWYTEQNGGSLYTFNSPLSGDLNLYAKWTYYTNNTILDYNRKIINSSNSEYYYYFTPFRSTTYIINYTGKLSIYNLSSSSTVMTQRTAKSNTTELFYLNSGNTYRFSLSGYVENSVLISGTVLVTDGVKLTSNRKIIETKTLEVGVNFSEVLGDTFSKYQWYHDIERSKLLGETFALVSGSTTFDSERRFIVIYGRKI